MQRISFEEFRVVKIKKVILIQTDHHWIANDAPQKTNF